MSGIYDSDKLLLEARDLRTAAGMHPERKAAYLARAAQCEELVRLSMSTPMFAD